MVFHVGIDPWYGSLSYCNEYKKITVDIKINEINSNEIERVALMFEEIKSKINGELGYACIFLYGIYGNEIRKKFIECGLNSGFKNIEIINWQTAYYLNAMSQINYKPLNGNVIWINYSFDFYVWEINNRKAKFCGFWNNVDPLKMNELEKIVDESKLNKGPDFVLCNNQIDGSNLGKISECQCFYYDNVNYGSKGSLLKARITAGDSELVHLEIFEFLADNISLNIDDQEITTFEKYQLLPITVSLKLKKPFGQILVCTCTKEDINIPDANNIKVVFEVDMNGIYFVNFSSANKFLSLNENNVIMYDDETQNLTIFPASIDYGFGGKKVGVEYNSPTVIKEVMKYFGSMSLGNSLPLREIHYLTEIKRFYVLKFGHNKLLIEEGRVIIDLIDEAINRSELSKDSITLIIPFNFSEIQRENYLEVAEVAGLTNISFIDEQTALAFGYEDKYDAIHGAEYLLINISATFTKITLNKVGEFDKENCLQKTIDSENFDLSKLTFFDNIINSAEGNNTEIVNFDVLLENLFDAVNELITNATNLTTIVVSNEIPYAFLQDNFPNFSIIVLENCEKLIVKGAALA